MNKGAVIRGQGAEKKNLGCRNQGAGGRNGRYDFKKISPAPCTLITAPFLIFIWLLVCAIPAFAGGKPVIYWEKKYSEKIRQVVFENAAGIDGFPLKFVSTEKKLIFYQPDGEELKREVIDMGEEVVYSDNGNYKAVISHKGADRQLESIRIRIEGEKGQVKELDKGGTILFSPGNDYFIHYLLKDGIFDFYKMDGETSEKHKFDGVQFIRTRFSGNGEFVLVSLVTKNKVQNENKTTNEIETIYQYEQQILLLNNEGKIIWRFDWKDIPRGFDISSDGKRIVIASETRLVSYLNDFAGNAGNSESKVTIKWDQELIPGGNEITISRSGNNLALTREANKRVILLNNSTGKIEWKKDIEDKLITISSPFTSMDLTDNYLLISAKKSRYSGNDASYLYIFDREGRIVWEKEFNEREIKVRFSDDERFVVVQGDQSLRLFEMK